MQGDPNRAKRVSLKQGADADILTAPGFHRGHLCARWAGSAASSLSAGQGTAGPMHPSGSACIPTSRRLCQSGRRRVGSGAGLSPVLWASPLLPGRLFQVTKHFCPQLINTHLLKKQTLKWQTTFFIGTSSASPQTTSTRHLAWERAKDTSGSLQQNPGRPEHGAPPEAGAVTLSFLQQCNF